MATVERVGVVTCMAAFKKIVKLAGRAFYDDIEVVVLDALTDREWVRDDDLAQHLKLNPSQIRKTIKSFEKDKLVAVCHRKETAKRKANTMCADSCYCCLDYGQICDVLRYRLHKMKGYLDGYERNNNMTTYLCTSCKKKYNSLDVLHLISTLDDDFHCEWCQGKLVVEENVGNNMLPRMDMLARNDMLARMEAQLRPLVEQLNAVKDLSPPELRSLEAWEESRRFVGDIKIDVTISGVDHTGGSVAVRNEDESQKRPLPPWMNGR